MTLKCSSVLGSYIPHTPMAALDARVKLFVLALTVVGLFTFDESIALVVGIAVCAASVIAAQCTLTSVVRSLKPAIIILVFSLIANAFVLDGSADLALIGSFGVSFEGMYRGLVAVMRIILMVALSLTIATSTTPPQIADAFMSVLKPFERFGLPARDISMVLSIAMRFVPMVSDEIDRIRLSQMSRGVNFNEGTLAERLRVWLSVITPLVVDMFVRADALADAMECRAYGKTNIRARSAKKLGKTDKIIVLLAIMLFIFLLIIS